MVKKKASELKNDKKKYTKPKWREYINKAVGCLYSCKNAYRKFCSTRVPTLRVCVCVRLCVCEYCEFSDLFRFANAKILNRFLSLTSLSILYFVLMFSNRINLTWILKYILPCEFSLIFSICYAIWNIYTYKKRECEHNLSFIRCCFSLTFFLFDRNEMWNFSSVYEICIFNWNEPLLEEKT